MKVSSDEVKLVKSWQISRIARLWLFAMWEHRGGVTPQTCQNPKSPLVLNNQSPLSGAPLRRAAFFGYEHSILTDRE
jgi:hypothetical protein